ncbi:MAG: hypothetical protein E4G94_08940, partial [ANME-2 cluster archaeon]
MRKGIITLGLIVLVTVSLLSLPAYAKGGKPAPTVEAGNQLSYPVIWAEGVPKALPGTPDIPTLKGDWLYQWGSNGEDPDITPASCPPDPDEGNRVLNPSGDPYCDDLMADTLTTPAGVPTATHPLPLAKAYIQKDQGNEWQAGTYPNNGSNPAEVIQVDLVDWGDNLESVDWTTRSKVRTELVLFEDQSYG